jgi:hypothetical protein
MDEAEADPRDINLVVSQARCSCAMTALKKMMAIWSMPHHVSYQLI